MPIDPLAIPDHPFKAYIFDCDGTIADTMPAHFRAWTRAMNELGGTFPEDLFYSWGGVPTHVIVERLNKRFGTKLDIESTPRIKERYFMELIPEVLPIEPVVALVKQFHETAPMAVASGGHREVVVQTLDALGLTAYFDAIVAMEDVVHGKPAPDPFLEAARRLGVAPEACLVFEDSPTGIEAAKAAGMRYVLVPTPAVELPA
ncbi:MAG: HAD family phosphatase [Terrimicrobiaceae bacterium]|nr:HAD family phosphatase [Terrimicrobiaceae bacterium]